MKQFHHILLDTDVLSNASKKSPPPPIIEFMTELKAGTVAVATTTIFELERGNLLRMETDLQRGLELAAWLERFLQTKFFLLPKGVEAERILAKMSVCGPLGQFWIRHPNSDKKVFGCDPIIAAIAISYETPIASCNTKDFLLIHKYFPLPGLYDPMKKVWHVKPPVGWALDDPANDDRMSPRKFDWQDAFDFDKKRML